MCNIFPAVGEYGLLASRDLIAFHYIHVTDFSFLYRCHFFVSLSEELSTNRDHVVVVVFIVVHVVRIATLLVSS